MTMVYVVLDTLMAVAEMPMPEVWTPDVKVFAYCVGVSLAMSIVFSLVPACGRHGSAWRTARARPATPAGRPRFNLALLAMQIALSTALLVGASLLSRAFTRATTGDVGYALSGLTAATFLPMGSRGGRRRKCSALRSALEQASVQSNLPQTSLVGRYLFVRRLGSRSDSAATARRRRETGDRWMSASALPVIGIPVTTAMSIRGREGAPEAHHQRDGGPTL